MPRRRGQGEGAVFRREDGLWVARLDVGRNENGQRKRRTLYGKTRKEVSAKLQIAQAELRAGQLIDPGRLTVGQYLSRWLEHIKSTVEPRTWVGYETIVRLHLAPVLGRVPLKKLTPLDLQELYTAKSLERSSRTVHHIHACANTALSQAVRWGLLPRNPAGSTEPPRPTLATPDAILDVEQAQVLIAALDKERMGALFITALVTGMRLGEFCGLRWSDLDLETGELVIRQTVWWPKGGYAFKPWPKNRKVRQVSVAVSVLPILRMHRDRLKFEKSKAGEFWQDLDLVFPDESGLPYRHQRVLRSLNRVLSACELPRIRTHDLRHTAASILLAIGTPPRDVQEILGHSSYKITMDLYGHLMPGAQREAANRMDAALFNRQDASKTKKKS